MTFDEYQKRALTTAIGRGDVTLDRTIGSLGLAGEAGEVADKWKKILVYQDGVLSDGDVAELTKEIGDVVWYAAVLSHYLGLSFDAVMRENVRKLAARGERGTIKGAGDNR